MTRLYLTRILVAVAALLAIGVATAQARAGGGFSFGSRGMRTFSVPAPTPTAPRPAMPIQRSLTQPAPLSGAGMGSPAGGLGRGLVAGLIGGGLIGLLLGNGMGSIFSLILQIGLVFFLVRLGMSLFARRAAMAGGVGNYARSAAGPTSGAAAGLHRDGSSARSAEPLSVSPSDYADFERLLTDVQDAYGREDAALLRQVTTPEMASYFEEELAANAAKGLANKVSGAKLLQGDLSEAWREVDADYASVAMRFEALDMLIERATGRVVGGDPARPQTATELWTFRRERGSRDWRLSAIQQV
jgi:predicted lipid-binding transport protein (Tim44 family)